MVTQAERWLILTWPEMLLAKIRAAPDPTNYGRLSDLSECWI
jgi:hypothetical protein